MISLSTLTLRLNGVPSVICDGIPDDCWRRSSVSAAS